MSSVTMKWPSEENFTRTLDLLYAKGVNVKNILDRQESYVKGERYTFSLDSNANMIDLSFRVTIEETIKKSKFFGLFKETKNNTWVSDQYRLPLRSGTPLRFILRNIINYYVLFSNISNDSFTTLGWYSDRLGKSKERFLKSFLREKISSSLRNYDLPMKTKIKDGFKINLESACEENSFEPLKDVDPGDVRKTIEMTNENISKRYKTLNVEKKMKINIEISGLEPVGVWRKK